MLPIAAPSGHSTALQGQLLFARDVSPARERCGGDSTDGISRQREHVTLHFHGGEQDPVVPVRRTMPRGALLCSHDGDTLTLTHDPATRSSRPSPAPQGRASAMATTAGVSPRSGGTTAPPGASNVDHFLYDIVPWAFCGRSGQPFVEGL